MTEPWETHGSGALTGMRGCCVVQVVSEEDNTNLLFKPGSLEHWTPDPDNTEALEMAKCTVVRDVDGLYGRLNY